jgi:D-3-phosphoglycerate dehydrogenase
MRILFADAVDLERVDKLQRTGNECVVRNLSAEELPGQIAGFDALVVRSTKVTRATIEAADRLSLVVRAGAGTDNIDREAASAAGIYLCNVPGRNAIAVAELAMGLLLAIDRQIADGAADLRAGVWDKGKYANANGIHGRRISIIGLGDVGLALADRAKAFGLVVSALRKDGRSASTQSRIRSIGIRLVDTEHELLGDADIVSIHVPKSDSTVGMIDGSFLSKVPDGAILLNTSRGNVIDEAALLEALTTRGFRAGLDVFADEPGSSKTEWVSPLAQHPGVVGSHHIGASTKQAQESVADGVVEVIEAFQNGDPENCLNLVTDPSGSSRLSIRHLDQVGVLAKVLLVIGRSGLNVQQMQNQVFEGATAAVATINVHGTVTRDLLSSLEALDEVISASETH